MNSLYRRKGLIAGALVGNVMEFFDFIIYVYLSTYITQNFFPLQDQFVANILMFSVFASGYLTRPFGGMLFGYIGDRYGRKLALIHSIILITLSTVCIGLLPVYSEIGVFSPLLLVICRLIQGFAVSGEQSGAAVYLSENLSSTKKGFIGSLVLGSSYFGVLLGSLTCLVVSSFFSEQQMVDYGWRIPFLLSFILGSLSLFYRTKSVESAEFIKIKLQNKLSKTPVKDTFKHHWRDVILIIFIVMGLAVPIYMYTIYIPNYISMIVGFSAKRSLYFSTFGLLFISILVPLVGIWSDKMGNEKMLMLGLCLSSTLGYPIFLLLSSGLDLYIILGQLCLGITASLIAAPLFGVILKIFPTRLRYTAISVVFNTSMAIFGSTVPIVSMALIKYFENKAFPGIYLSLSGIVALSMLYFRFFKPFRLTYKISEYVES
jgi:MHS family proline/betaine transporter-like MFS transporter